MTAEFLEIGLAILVFALVFGFIFGAGVVRRGRLETLGYWPLAWALLIFSGIARLGLPFRQVDFVTGAMIATLMLAGALCHVNRRVPGWLIPLGLGLGVAYLLLDFAGYSDVARLFTLGIEPAFFAAAAWVVYQAPVDRRTARWHSLLAPGFLLFFGLDLFDWFSGSDGVGEIAVWLVVAIPVCTMQAVAIYDQIQAHAEDAARELEESVSMLRATLESTADGILVVDLVGDFTSFNHAFGEMWRIPQEILDRGISGEALKSAMGQLKDPNAFFDKVQSLYAEPGVESFDTIEFKDGRVFERYSRPQRVGDEVVGRVWSFRDVTKRRVAEEVAARHQSHLEELVEDRTRELIASRDRLQQADRLAAVGTLAAGVAHQINNPVGAILNSAEYALLCENDASAMETWRSALEVSVEESRRCAAIVRSMLQFAREEEVEKRVEDLNKVVQRAHSATLRYVHENGARIELVLSSTPILVEMSSIEIEQVLVNLIRNAVESREEGGARVSVQTECKDGRALAHVYDDGCGIKPRFIARVFDPFFSTRLRVGGTGLGLSVAHGIVNDHGGEIRISSEPDEGTAITIELPRSVDEG